MRRPDRPAPLRTALQDRDWLTPPAPKPWRVIPLLAGIPLFIYAVYRLDPVFILGQGAGLFVYCRNLYLIRRRERRLAEAGT